jgi:hypothetical protein
MEKRARIGVTGLGRDADEILLEGLLGGDIGATILRQEARGQQELVRSHHLPREGSVEGRAHGRQGSDGYELVRDADPATRAGLEAWGFVFGAVLDDLFIEAALPAGWSFVASEHSMHSTVQDARGRERLSVFYKAAFYDRSAHARVLPRYRIEDEYLRDGPDSEKTRAVQVRVMDTAAGTVVFSAPERTHPDQLPREDRKAAYQGIHAASDEALAWLGVHYPNWEDPFAYWERDKKEDV